MITTLEEIKSRALDELRNLNELKELESWRVGYLGRKGTLTQLLRGLSSLPIEERREAGAAANKLKSLLEQALADKQELLRKAGLDKLLQQSSLDVTLPGRPAQLGRLHPTTRILRQAGTIFSAMGFEAVEGPEVEWDYYNFEALNIPQDHPARDMWATLWIDYQNEEGERPMLLRTHTSPMQIRFMERRQPPIRVIMPGKVYRYEATDATHESMFYQIEGLAVDKGISMAHLKGTLYEFARRLFGLDRKVRFRCDYFPFVEPGVDMAIDCFICQGNGCRVCGGEGWIEILGAGMVHPDVLRRVDYDPEIYTGFAFGMGLERIPMLKYGIDDIRLFYSNDLRFLEQF
ncbi:MAG: phenylalanine--tRNA ligase subunit alpha [Dehalococcoidia bacterium]|nr:Phenylalanine--tRNA ligase alpha subunit [Chloroflexota bacterium]MBT9160637.1 Phenylalanine--tRNA ligase alpha subunit [Chloroflexota bacterium]MBT9162180.1 Phenylalanine--tRNA ligase alpha subunit [Chloroflexota bacterium]